LSIEATRARDQHGLDVGLTTGALRAVLSAPAIGAGRAQELARRLGDAIRVGLILDGERLPSEVQLSGQLGIASATLREVFSILRGEGLVVTRRGKQGGTFVTAPPNRSEALSSRLASMSMLEIRDSGDLRSAVFAMAAELAAHRAGAVHVTKLHRLAEGFPASLDAGELRRADSSFSLEVAAAAQSPRLAQEDLRLRAEMGDVLWLAPSAEDVKLAAALRVELTSAIERQDALAARERATAIVAHDTERLLEHRRAAYRRQAQHYSATSARVMTQIDEAFEQVAASLVQLASEVAASVDDARAAGPVRRQTLKELRPDIDGLLTEHSAVLSGCGLLVRPGLLDDVDRWMEWQWITENGRREPLRINLNPDAPDFYDYTVTEWFEAAQRTEAINLAGPYVDASCTGAYVFTMALPVMLRDEFLGVVAADIPLSVIETMLMGHVHDDEAVGSELRADSSAMQTTSVAAQDSAGGIVLNRERRVLISTSPRFLPGELAPPVTGMHEHLFDPITRLTPP